MLQVIVLVAVEASAPTALILIKKHHKNARFVRSLKGVTDVDTAHTTTMTTIGTLKIQEVIFLSSCRVVH